MKDVIGEIISLHIYPIKSCGSIELDRVELDEFGPKWDRRWMVVNDEGAFFTQRKFPKMSLIQPNIINDQMSLSAPGQESISLSLEDLEREPLMDVKVWGEPVQAHDCGPEVAAWLSAFLGKDCKLVFMGSSHPRVRQKSKDFKVGFADSRPVLLTNTASMDHLNAHESSQYSMARFRPNVVIKGPKAYEEDGWGQVTLGAVSFDLTQKCERCGVPAVDQTTGKKDGAQLLNLLNKHRSPEGAPIFGVRMVHTGPGTLQVGDSVCAAP
jgi:hypothetical protein